jgi:hypothetical protein
MEAARTLKANLKLEGKPCGWCQVALRLGEDATVCNACEKEHHSRCWDGNGGCSTQGCVNAPLRRLDAPAPGAPPPPPPPFGSPFPTGGPQYGAPSPYGAPPQYGGGYGGAPGGAPPPGYMVCPNCRAAILAGSQICPACRAITTPDGMYHGPKVNAPGAVSSMVLGIIGLVLCGVILGPIAIVQANNAKRAIANDPSMGGQGFATAGTILGVIALVLNAIGFLVAIGSH